MLKDIYIGQYRVLSSGIKLHTVFQIVNIEGSTVFAKYLYYNIPNFSELIYEYKLLEIQKHSRVLTELEILLFT